MLNQKTRELIKQRKKRTKYTSIFKLAAVEKLVRNPDKPMTHISKKLGVANPTLWQWYNKYKELKNYFGFGLQLALEKKII